ncbi:MAG: sigma-54 dependent transcriptional regulator [Candidatus Latescibacteria bacterium]|nr:sigma-54 dependent transcriptional regulator [Candidatus Latescibacterota bacterium]
MNAHILIADDQPEVLDMLARSLVAEGRTVHACASGTEALTYLRETKGEVDLAILDLDFGPDEPDGLEVLQQMRSEDPDLPVIILTGKGTVDTAVAGLRLGAADFIEKDFYVEDRLELSLEKVDRMLRVLQENARLQAAVDDLDRENRYYRAEFGKRYQVVSVSPQMQQIMQQAQRIASIPRPVLILGDRGTGKELIAAAIHYGGNRQERPFVKVNCAALSATLLESELFGHEKGAYTGATEARAGRFETANGGTLFLDEVANTTPEFQQNILRAIEYQEVQRVGASAPIPVDVRIIAATNADLEQEMAEGRFRRDLYDRLCFEVIRIPRLGQRREDVQPLAEFFAEKITQEVPDLENRPFSPDALKRLYAHAWPGNVRELKFAVERAACVALGAAIEVEDLPPEFHESAPAPSSEGYESQTRAFELGLLRRALEDAAWNQREAAKSLKLTYDQFRHLYRKYRLDHEKP